MFGQISRGDIFEPSVNGQSYQIIEYLNNGGQAIIYKCKRLSDGQVFALKLFTNQPHDREKYLYEQFKALENFKYCVNVRDIIDGHSYVLIMDLAESDLSKSEFHDTTNVCIIMRQVILGIKELHDKKIVHRDLKPSNILSYGNSQFKIADFGISKSLQEIQNHTAGIGTRSYAAPEYLQMASGNNKNSIDLYKCDIWAFGVIFFEKLFNQILFTGNSLKEIESKIIKFNPDECPKLNVGAPHLILSLLKSIFSPVFQRPTIQMIINTLNAQIDARIMQITTDISIVQLEFLGLEKIDKCIEQQIDSMTRFRMKFKIPLNLKYRQQFFKDQFGMEYQISLVLVDNRDQFDYLSQQKGCFLLPHKYLINVYIFIEFGMSIFLELFDLEYNKTQLEQQYRLQQLIQCSDQSFDIRQELLYQVVYFLNKGQILEINPSVPHVIYNFEQYQHKNPQIIKNLITFLFAQELFIDKAQQDIFELLNNENFECKCFQGNCMESSSTGQICDLCYIQKLKTIMKNIRELRDYTKTRVILKQNDQTLDNLEKQLLNDNGSSDSGISSAEYSGQILNQNNYFQQLDQQKLVKRTKIKLIWASELLQAQPEPNNNSLTINSNYNIRNQIKSETRSLILESNCCGNPQQFQLQELMSKSISQTS